MCAVSVVNGGAVGTGNNCGSIGARKGSAVGTVFTVFTVFTVYTVFTVLGSVLSIVMDGAVSTV